MPVVPQVRTAPRPCRLKGSPKMASTLFFSELQISSRQRLRTAAKTHGRTNVHHKSHTKGKAHFDIFPFRLVIKCERCREDTTTA